ncbi:GNAT family N-acetyltransferase [Niallia endozanthoxylica]|uniref:GNAT family N-acetyltransferase n=1 Tax=Niallia endozanthoxylica TaxID=2036016 RepID=A0A5J5HUX1_9BACI|nr:GNAT family N-acetyltransferase [Niallia endozanthoxylica]KAA9024362.1 GNAT family N-acetyltransferase [Niallia endozanthoxylica]
MKIVWEEITKNHMSHIESVLQLYDTAFPKDLREPHQILYNALDKAEQNPPNRFRFLVGLMEGKPVSFATAHYLAEVNCGFIVYLGTDPHERSKGLGSQALGTIEEYLNQDAILAGKGSIRAFVLETEKQESANSEEERETCLKRDYFYKRNGYKTYKGIDYIQPPLNGGNEAIPLKLNIKKKQQTDFSRDEAQELIYAMYDQKYCLVNRIPTIVLNDCLKEMSIPKGVNI